MQGHSTQAYMLDYQENDDELLAASEAGASGFTLREPPGCGGGSLV